MAIFPIFESVILIFEAFASGPIARPVTDAGVVNESTVSLPVLT